MLKKYLPKSEFARNVITLMTGTTIAQAIPVAISPILTRLYTPEDFGTLSLFLSFVAIVSAIATARYEMAIMLPAQRDEDDARSILVLSLIICTIVSFVTLLIVLLFNEQLAKMMDNPEVGPWLYWAPLTIFFAGVYNAFNFWSTRQKTFKRNAMSRVTLAMVTAGTQLGFGLKGASFAGAIKLGYTPFGAAGLIAGSIAGQVISSIVISWSAFRDLFVNRHRVTKAKIRSNMKRYRSFALINTPHVLIDSLQDHGIVFLINYFFTSTILGFYSFAFRLLKAPVGLIGSSMYQVFYQKASEAHNDNRNLQGMVTAVYKRLLIFALPVFTALFFILPWLFSAVFGEKWRVSGEIAQIILPWLFLNFLISPVSSLPIILNKQKQAMLFSIADITVKVVSILIGGYYRDFKLTFVLISVGCSSIQVFGMYWYYHIAGRHNVAGYENKA